MLITGSILAVNRKRLIRSLAGYIPTILAAVAGAAVFGIAIGLVFGITPDHIMMLYVLPIMGGGNGAGAIPLLKFMSRSRVARKSNTTRLLSRS